MTKTDLSNYYHRHCRMRMRSGTEVYGVLWEDELDKGKLYFASRSAHLAYQEARSTFRAGLNPPPADVVNPEDIIAVESL